MIENFSWLIEGKLAGCGGLIHHKELACYLVNRVWRAEEAMAEVRAHRPGSIVPEEQQVCVIE